MSSFMGVGYTTDPLCHTSRYCIMEQVKEYASNASIPFPVEDFNTVVSSAGFAQFMNRRFAVLRQMKQHWNADSYKDNTGIVLEGGKVKYMWITFNATFEGFWLTPAVGTKIYEDWDSLIKSYIDGTSYYQVHLMYLYKVLQDILVREAFKNILSSLFVAFCTLALVTWNWYVAVLGVANITSIMVYFLGFWPILGWELDVYNVIFCIMAVGLSVDYTVHLLHAFNESSEESLEERVKSAVSHMGISVLSGATTTLLAATPLFFTLATFFKRFGTFVFLIIFFAISTSLFLLVPLLLVIGPAGDYGDIKLFYWLKARLTAKPQKETGTLRLTARKTAPIMETE